MSSDTKQFPTWCVEHQATIGADGRCEWDVKVEERLDGIPSPFPARMDAHQIGVARAALTRDQQWYERRISADVQKLEEIARDLAELDRREAAA